MRLHSSTSKEYGSHRMNDLNPQLIIFVHRFRSVIRVNYGIMNNNDEFDEGLNDFGATYGISTDKVSASGDFVCVFTAAHNMRVLITLSNSATDQCIMSTDTRFHTRELLWNARG